GSVAKNRSMISGESSTVDMLVMMNLVVSLSRIDVTHHEFIIVSYRRISGRRNSQNLCKFFCLKCGEHNAHALNLFVHAPLHIVIKTKLPRTSGPQIFATKRGHTLKCGNL